MVNYVRRKFKQFSTIQNAKLYIYGRIGITKCIDNVCNCALQPQDKIRIEK